MDKETKKPRTANELHDRLQCLGDELNVVANARQQHADTFYFLCSYASSRCPSLDNQVLRTILESVDVNELLASEAKKYDAAWRKIKEIVDEAVLSCDAIIQKANESQLENLKNEPLQ
jgi:hypothetical protein